jgi:hypothetical protein
VLIALVALLVNASCVTTETATVAYYVPQGETARKDGPSIGCIRQCRNDYPRGSEGQLDCIRICPGVLTADGERCDDFEPGEAAVCYDHVRTYRRKDWGATGALIGAGVVLVVLVILLDIPDSGDHR